jgi:hypothetical protein
VAGPGQRIVESATQYSAISGHCFLAARLRTNACAHWRKLEVWPGRGTSARSAFRVKLTRRPKFRLAFALKR